MVTKATAETNRSRDDDRASYKDTHGLSPIRSVCMGRPYMLSPENAVTLGTQVIAKRSGALPGNIEKGRRSKPTPLRSVHREPEAKAGNRAILWADHLPSAQDALLPKQLGLTGGPQVKA